MPVLKKKFLLSLSTLFIVLLLFAGAAYAEGTGVITGESVNFRSSASTSSEILMQFSEGSKVEIIAEDVDWYKVSFNGLTGWVFGDYVKKTDAAVEGTITGSNVNMRSGAGTDYKVVGKLDRGAAVSVCEYSGNWAKIKLKDGTFAWVCRDYIYISDSNASRSLEGSRPSAESSAEADNSELRSKIVEYAKKYLGVKYVYGGSSPKGFDCSGLVYYVFKNFGIKLPRSSESMGAGGEKISKEDLRPGDLVFFDTNGGLNRIEHVGIYIGDGKFIHSSSSKSAKCVIISTLTEGFYKETYMTAKRYID